MAVDRLSLLGLCLGATAALVLLDAAISPAVASGLPRRMNAARMIGSAESAAPARATITLALRQVEELQDLIAAQSDQASPLFRRWLTPQEFADRFAPSPGEYQRVETWLSSGGLTVQRFANRLRLDVRGEVGAVEKHLGVHLRRFDLDGRTVMASADAPAIPTEVRHLIEHVRLDDAPLAHPLVRVNTSTGSRTVLGPRDVHVAYGMLPLLSAGLDGSGQKIAIVARSDFKLGDISRFRAQFGLPAAAPSKKFVAGNPGIGSIRGVCAGLNDPIAERNCIEAEEGEVLLDTQWSGAAAPGAEILVDIADTDIDASLADIVSHHSDAKVISISFGICERFDEGQSPPLFFPLYLQAAAQGQSIFVASGDDGADGCRDGGDAGVNVLASDVHVTSVGGTSVDPGFDDQGNATQFVGEQVWNDSSGASGGGESVLIARPSYQGGTAFPSGAMRLQPDVALSSSPFSPGFVLIFEGFTGVAGGTSAAAPVWAGMAAILNQASRVNGLGALNPALYRAGRKQYEFGAPPAFRDTTSGDNSFNGVGGFAAVTGYDLTTGLGSADLAALAQRLFECPGDCSGDTQVTVDEILLGVNVALENEPYGRCAASDVDADGQITVNEIIAAVDRALRGCLTD